MQRIFADFSYSLLQSSCYKKHVFFRKFCNTTITQMSSLKGIEIIGCEKCRAQTRRSFFPPGVEEAFNWDTSVYSVFQFLSNFPDLPLLTSLFFSNDGWKLTAPLVGNSQVVWTIEPSWKLEINLLQVTSYKSPSCNFHLSYLPNNPFMFETSIECLDSATLNGKNT